MVIPATDPIMHASAVDPKAAGNLRRGLMIEAVENGLNAKDHPRLLVGLSFLT